MKCDYWRMEGNHRAVKKEVMGRVEPPRQMPIEIIVAGMSLLGTLAGTFGGIIVSSRLTTYRIEQLEKKVDKHNTVIDRTYKLEQEYAVLDEKIRVANHRIEDLEQKTEV